MKICKRLVIISFLFSTNVLFGQDLCLKLDSLVVSYVPWDLKTIMAWSDHEVRNAPSEVLQTIVIKDKEKLTSMVECKIGYNKVTNNVETIDVRMVIDFYTGKEKITMSIDSDMYYKFFGNIYQRNNNLINWINSNITKST